MVNANSKLLWLSLIMLLLPFSESHAQSLDPSKPTAIRSSKLAGQIAARDLGDARLTDHYYKFTGTPGDLLITIRSQNLNGDLDVFTAVGLRPLLKLTLYAENSNPVTKGIYLRKREDLILRIEARSPNDDQGTYELFFGGSFEPIAGGPDTTEDETARTEAPSVIGNRKTKRVSSVGARLPEPEPPVTEVAATPTPEPTPEATPAETISKARPEKPVSAPKTTPSRTPPRTRRPTTRRTPAPSTAKPKATDTAVEEPKKTEETPKNVEPPKSKSTAKSTAKRGATTTRPSKPASPTETAEPESGPRLVIETNDGTLINRSMSTVRRVIVENGQVVITGKDGKIDRILLVNVVRMSIAQ